MFIFYYAVLSEVSPPTALSAFAAAAITGGDGFKTMMLTLRYTAPAFLVPFAFVLTDNGQGLLLQGGLGTIALAVAVSAVAVCALAVALGGWLRGPVPVAVRVRVRGRLAAAALPRAGDDRDRARAGRARRDRAARRRRGGRAPRTRRLGGHAPPARPDLDPRRARLGA